MYEISLNRVISTGWEPMDQREPRSTVLVVEDERYLTDYLHQWLNEGYEVLTAHTGREAVDLHHEHVLVTFIDCESLDSGLIDLLEELRSRDHPGRVVSVETRHQNVSKQDSVIDDRLRKPLDRNEVRESVDRIFEQAVYDEEIRKWLTLLSKKATLEHEMDAAELEQSDEYDKLVAQIEVLRTRADTTRDEMPDERLDAVLEEIDCPTSGDLGARGTF